MRIRDAEADDWPPIWAFARPIIAAGETYPWPRDTSEAWARAYWMERERPASRLVAETEPGDGCAGVAESGRVAGTVEIHPNLPGQGSHVANAGFMVDPAFRGRGVGRALGEAALDRAVKDGFHAMQFNAVVETNTGAVKLWRSLGFETLATVPEGFRHPELGLVGMHIMYKLLES
ncbi:GNAT family N-acetyltransferase [Glycomyces sp. L485]|uniref:GNAT family N-acetyltransferase n=1 Tax=Glycomyces sp. L485 TaxID=2909235 RepID=UPI001F4B87C6|nr:N-acetyltransferase [Glycomyces sp. L485]MCH7230151.1 GNAT family N-acetyltransferase [Glycomyces sp. L485]